MSVISVHDAERIAYENSRRLDIEAPGLPVAIKVGDEVQILVMIFGPGGPPPKRYRPPRFAVTLAFDGKVISAGPTSGTPLGNLASEPTEPGVGFAERLGIDEASKNRDLFSDLSPKVWQAYAAGASAKDPATRALLADYWHLFNGTIAHGIAPFYLQASPAFFTWVRSAVSSP